MTQDEIIDMATEAGLAYNHDDYPDIWDTFMNVGREEIVAFANLVAKHTLSNIDPSKFMSHQEVMEAARLAEREACAKMVDHILKEGGGTYGDAIRARGQA